MPYELFISPSSGASTLIFAPGWFAQRCIRIGEPSFAHSLLIPVALLGLVPFGFIGSVMWIGAKKADFFSLPAFILLIIALLGIGAAFSFKHVGYSNFYFLMFAIPCLNLLGTSWVLESWKYLKGNERKIVSAIILLSFLPFLDVALSYGSKGFLTGSHVLRGLPISDSDPRYSMSKEEYQVAEWISKNTPKDIVIAGERFWTSSGDGDAGARFFYYSAFSKRQVYLEGWAYSYLRRSSEGRQELKRRIAVLDVIFSNEKRARKLMLEEGIDAIIVNRESRFDFCPLELDCLYENEKVSVYSVPEAVRIHERVR